MTVVPWSRLPGAAAVDVGPSSGSMIELPGPRTRPVRPHLELASGPAGIAARVVQGDGVVAALAVRDGEVIALAATPLAVAPRSDGVWAMYRDGVVAHDRKGGVLHRVALSAVALFAAPRDAAWLASNEQAWHLGGDGTVLGPFAWRDALGSFVRGEALCRRDGNGLACLARDGATSTVALATALEPFEQLLALDGDRLVTLQGTTVRLRRAGEVVGAWTFQGGGVDAAGAGFAVSAADGKLTLWRAAGEPRELPAVGSGSLSAASVGPHDVALYSQGHLDRHRGTAAPESRAIDEAGYRSTVFPAAWEMSPLHAIALRPDGDLVLAASGPAGVALITLRAR